MKKIFLFTVCILFEYAAFARGNITIDTAQYVAIYDYQCRTLDAKGQPVVDSLQMALQVSRYISRFSTYYEYLVTTKQATSRPFTDIAFSDPLLTETHIFFQNHPAGRLTALESMPPYIYQTDEKVPKIHWTLSADTLTIAGHLCHKATGQFGGRLWTVFYATDIPSSAGPWKLCGLSGLILSASDEAHIHSFVLASIEQDTNPIIFNDFDAIHITAAKFTKYRNQTLCDKRYPLRPDYYILAKNRLHIEVFTRDVKSQEKCYRINGIAVPDSAHVFQPLELE